MGKVEMILKNPQLYAIYALGRIMKGSVSADRRYLEILYKYKFGKPLNFKNPQTFNEKLQWLKLYDRKPEYTMMVDKHLVKQYVADKIGGEYIIPTLGVWDRFEDIDFDKLPEQFVLKCTHDSGGLVICTDKSKLDKGNARKKITHCLKRNYFLNTREWPYKNVKPRIIAEKYISQDNGKLPVDYKFFCFNGKIDSVMLCLDRELGKPRFVFYDKNWSRLLYQNYEPDVADSICKPYNFDRMIELVETLAQVFEEIRIDLYNVQGHIYFGEYTFFNQSGFDQDITYETDKMWGQKIVLENTSGGNNAL